MATTTSKSSKAASNTSSNPPNGCNTLAAKTLHVGAALAGRTNAGATPNPQIPNTVNQIHVAAAIIHDDAGRLLATQRGHGQWKGYWEFPGGKIEPGESPEQALQRELWEELEAHVTIEHLVETVEWDYPDFHLTMHCFRCHLKGDHLRLKEHQAARWLDATQLDSVDWLPADRDLVQRLSHTSPH